MGRNACIAGSGCGGGLGFSALQPTHRSASAGRAAPYRARWGADARAARPPLCGLVLGLTSRRARWTAGQRCLRQNRGGSLERARRLPRPRASSFLSRSRGASPLLELTSCSSRSRCGLFGSRAEATDPRRQADLVPLDTEGPARRKETIRGAVGPRADRRSHDAPCGARDHDVSGKE